MVIQNIGFTTLPYNIITTLDKAVTTSDNMSHELLTIY